MSLASLCFDEEKALIRIHEPTGMSRDELLQWYLEQPTPFRRVHRARIMDLSTRLLADAILGAVRFIDEKLPEAFND